MYTISIKSFCQCYTWISQPYRLLLSVCGTNLAVFSGNRGKYGSTVENDNIFNHLFPVSFQLASNLWYDSDMILCILLLLHIFCFVKTKWQRFSLISLFINMEVCWHKWTCCNSPWHANQILIYHRVNRCWRQSKLNSVRTDWINYPIHQYAADSSRQQ